MSASATQGGHKQKSKNYAENTSDKNDVQKQCLM